ncbi:MAG: methionine--tRNA ligase [Dehalococcoidia bacterium]|nr:methionine--tRNA ligase [Dehalococcoidia bacterium]
MSERILICVAWPYANSRLHLGHVAGAYLPADIFARYHRAMGNEVLMISGSDIHGTPVAIRAEQEGKTPAEIAQHFHALFLEDWQKLGISWDLFTTTGTENHTRVSQNIFLELLDKGLVYKQAVTQPYCEICQRHLPDRYVEGTCPICQSPGARGDQCEQCGKPMNPSELIKAQCKLCHATPIYRESEHFFLRLSAFQDDLLAWVKTKEHWRVNVRRFTQRYLEEGLLDRAITRDIDWGIPLPLPGYPGKSLYVWFEAVIGYLSAAIEWAKSQGTPDAWQNFWHDGQAQAYYFIGKDNIPFHTIVWPAILMGYGSLGLPYDVPANEFLTIESQKFSKSRNLAIWVHDFLSRYEADPLRYLLSVNMPESSDADFSWREFVRRNNDELVATYGNLVQRVLSFTYTRFNGAVPTPETLDSDSEALLAKAETTVIMVGRFLEGCRFKEAIKEALFLAQAANRYLDDKAPWKAIKDDAASAATSLYTAIGVISALKTIFYPFLPHSSQRLHEYLGFDGAVSKAGWRLVIPAAGQALKPPHILFAKLEEGVVAAEQERMGIYGS